MALTMTPEQLAAYRATCRRRAQEQTLAREARAQAARQLAREAADLLRDDYGATDVLLFGSLATDDLFGLHSDIDLAARGLDGAVLYAALGRLLSLSPDFEFDLVDLDTCPASLREAIISGGVPL